MGSNDYRNINIPGSKSYAHRLLISSSLSKENSTISNVELSNDIIATINCLKALGKKIEYNKDNKTVYISHEYNFNELNDEIILDAYESGSTYRFLIPISLLSGKKVIFKGTERLIQRGIGEYENIFKTQIENKNYALVIGNEGQGVSTTFKETGRAISLPMKEQMESLNAGISASVLMYTLLGKDI